MTDTQPSGAQQAMGDFAAGLVHFTHAAFYAGWPRAMSARNVAKQVFAAG